MSTRSLGECSVQSCKASSHATRSKLSYLNDNVFQFIPCSYRIEGDHKVLEACFIHRLLQHIIQMSATRMLVLELWY